MEIGIVAQPENDHAITVASDLHDDLTTAGLNVLADEAVAHAVGVPPTPVEDMAACPFVVSIGGDGTFLYTARHVGSTPIMGVNLGEVGFLNAVSPTEATDRVLRQVEAVHETGAPQFREVIRLVPTGNEWSLTPAVNEVAVQSPNRGHGRGLEVAVTIDGDRYTDGYADGVLIATPTGSTAYNLSEGGPLVHPAVDGLIVTGMSAATPFPSLVVDPDHEIVVSATGIDEAIVTTDGVAHSIDTPARVTIEIADEPGRIVGPSSGFFDALGKLEPPPTWD